MSYDGEKLHAVAADHVQDICMVFISIGFVVTKIMTFFKKYLHVGQQFRSGDGSVGWLAGCMHGRYSDLASVSLSD